MHQRVFALCASVYASECVLYFGVCLSVCVFLCVSAAYRSYRSDSSSRDEGIKSGDAVSTFGKEPPLEPTLESTNSSPSNGTDT